MQLSSNGSSVSGSTTVDLTQLDKLATVTVSISSLFFDQSPRCGGDNDEHVRMLAESPDQLPPIVVHGPSMRVIDGIHRVRAAIRRGEKTIAAKIYHGTDDEAFIFAVRLNITHGLPLTRAERTAATQRILASHPQWSDRMIATIAGLSAGTVAKVRRRSTAQNEQLTARIGKDGRIRPVNTSAGRLKTAPPPPEQPRPPTRVIPPQATVSPATADDIPRHLRTGAHPLPHPRNAPPPPATPWLVSPPPHREIHGRPEPSTAVDVVTVLDVLKKDPALRRSDPTQILLRCLDRYRIGVQARSKIVHMVPDHCAPLVAKLARAYASIWTDIATQLQQRRHHNLHNHTTQPDTQ